MSDENKSNSSGHATATVDAPPPQRANNSLAGVPGPGPNTVRVTFQPANKTFEFERGQLPYADHGKPESLLDVALNNNFFLDHACGGNCACTTCHVVVHKGEELLSEMDDEEADRLDMAAGLTLRSRLGCQAVINKPGELVVEIPEWNRNYVSEGHAPKE